MRVGIVVFEGVDLLDVGGPYEVFLTASRLSMRSRRPPPFDTVTVGPGDVRAYGGLRLRPHLSFELMRPFDILVVPGAIDIARVRRDTVLLENLRAAASQSRVVASVCTGAFILADIGLLPSSWTTHWEDVEQLEQAAWGKGLTSVRWVDTGHVVTSGGLSSGIAMALHLVDRFCGMELAVRTASQIDYAWDPSGARHGFPTGLSSGQATMGRRSRPER